MTVRNCDKCGSASIAGINAKCDDRCSITLDGKTTHDYVPSNLEIGGGDYIRFHFCLQCGSIQGKFPVTPG